MATATCSTIGTTLLELPTPASIESSVLFLKKLTGVTISQIVYARNLFEEKDFVDKCLDGIKIKLIKVTKDPRAGAQYLSKWLEGAFDAMERKFLRTLVLEIRENSSSSTLLESYSFRFTYQDKGAECSLETHENKETNMSTPVQGDTQKQVQQLLRNILIMTATMEKLPNNCCTMMRIEYYDNVTPPEYEPPGFKPLQENLSAFRGEASKFRCGKVSTPHHEMVVSTKQTTLEIAEKATVHDGKSVTDASLESQVQCLCGMTEVSSCMIKCSTCKTYQHAPCYKVNPGKDFSPSQHHTCRKCSEFDSNPKEEPDSCLYRRVLVECNKVRKMSLGKLIQELHIDCNKAIAFIKQLLRDGVLLQSTQPLPTANNPNLAFEVDQMKLRKLLSSQGFSEEDDGNNQGQKRKGSQSEDQVQVKRKKLSTRK